MCIYIYVLGLYRDRVWGLRGPLVGVPIISAHSRNSRKVCAKKRCNLLVKFIRHETLQISEARQAPTEAPQAPLYPQK